MYCPNCGCTNDDNATVCENCGTELESSKKTKPKIETKKKKTIIILVVILLVVLVTFAGIIGSILHKKTNSNSNPVNYPEVEKTTISEITHNETVDLTEKLFEDDDKETTEEKIKESSTEKSTTKKETTNKSNSSNKTTQKGTTKKSNIVSNNTTKKSTTSTTKAVHTEYRYRDKSFTTSSSNKMSGWTLYDTTYTWSDYGAWSRWSTNNVSSSSSRQTESRTTYRFYVFRCTKCGNRDPYSTPCDNCKTSAYFQWVETWYPTTGNSMTKHTLSTVPDKYYVYIDGVKWWFERDGYSDGQGGTGQPSKKEYRYRDRKQVATYHFYKWGAWSEWSTTPVSSSANREVETRKVN